MFCFICLNLFIDFSPNTIGMNAAWKWANNKIGKNKTILKLKSSEIWIKKPFQAYLRREKYHCPTEIISTVRTKGKAGYFAWELAGGQGDQEINLPWGPLEEFNFFVFRDLEVLLANPLLIMFL